jgi:hypothetical protein
MAQKDTKGSVKPINGSHVSLHQNNRFCTVKLRRFSVLGLTVLVRVMQIVHRALGRAVLESLEFEGSIDRSAGQFRVYADHNQDGTVYCWIGGGTGQEQTVFLRALREVLSPIDNPRYLLARRRIWRIFREDYFAVPDVLARKKEFAEEFGRRWNTRVGPVQVVFTRTPEGRKLLLRARSHSSGTFQKRAERVSCWR